MKYSFVLPAYKASFLRQSIDSILTQTYSEFELIIVNDASPEDLDSIVNSYVDSRIRYYKNEKNIGGEDLVRQWNHCVSLCKSDYLILASDDDIYDVNFLAEMDELVIKYPDANVFRPRIQYIDENNDLIDIGGFKQECISGIEFLYSWTKGWIESGVPFYVFKRSALDDAGGFADYPLAWFSDDATVLRLSNNGIITSTKILFSFRLSGQSVSTRLNTNRDVLNKLAATEQFYYECMSYITSFDIFNDYERCIQRNLQKDFPLFLQNDKVRWQLFHASFSVATELLFKAMQLPFISKKRLFLFYIIYLIKKIFRSI